MRDIIRNLIAFFGIILIIQIFKWRKIEETSVNINEKGDQNGYISELANLQPPKEKKQIPKKPVPKKPVRNKPPWFGWDSINPVTKPSIPKNLEDFLRLHPNENIKRNFNITPIFQTTQNDAVFYRSWRASVTDTGCGTIKYTSHICHIYTQGYCECYVCNVKIGCIFNTKMF